MGNNRRVGLHTHRERTHTLSSAPKLDSIYAYTKNDFLRDRVKVTPTTFSAVAAAIPIYARRSPGAHAAAITDAAEERWGEIASVKDAAIPALRLHLARRSAAQQSRRSNSVHPVPACSARVGRRQRVRLTSCVRACNVTCGDRAVTPSRSALR